MMKQMGIKQEDISAVRVIIEQEDTRTIIEPVAVAKITMQGQTSWQVTGNAREETNEAKISDADIGMVMEKTGANTDAARKALEETGGDIAEAIVRLSE